MMQSMHDIPRRWRSLTVGAPCAITVLVPSHYTPALPGLTPPAPTCPLFSRYNRCRGWVCTPKYKVDDKCRFNGECESNTCAGLDQSRVCRCKSRADCTPEAPTYVAHCQPIPSPPCPAPHLAHLCLACRVGSSHGDACASSMRPSFVDDHASRVCDQHALLYPLPGVYPALPCTGATARVYVLLRQICWTATAPALPPASARATSASAANAGARQQ